MAGLFLFNKFCNLKNNTPHLGNGPACRTIFLDCPPKSGGRFDPEALLDRDPGENRG